jgi:hypothetical protein
MEDSERGEGNKEDSRKRKEMMPPVPPNCDAFFSPKGWDNIAQGNALGKR